MRTSDTLRSSEVHDALEFVIGLGSRTHSPAAAAALVAERLCAILRARVCLIGQVPTDLIDVKMPWRPLAEFGWRDERQRHAIMSSLDDPEARDPTVVRILDRDDQFRTYARRELVADGDWYNSRYFQAFRGPAGLDDQAFSVWSGLPKRGWMGIIGLHRNADDPLFDAGTVTLLELLHRQMAVVLWQADADPAAPPSAVAPVSSLLSDHHLAHVSRTLTPAQRRVLPYLLQGHREDKIAEMLCRSRHTIHDHAMAVYKAFGVHNRVELLVKLGGDSTILPTPPEPTEPPAAQDVGRGVVQ